MSACPVFNVQLGLFILAASCSAWGDGTDSYPSALPISHAEQHKQYMDNVDSRHATDEHSVLPNNTRDPHAYSDGYDFGSLGKPEMDHQTYLASVIVDRLEGFTARDKISLTYDWQAWYGSSYDKALIRSEGEIETGRFSNARNELLWSHALTPYWDTQLGLRYDNNQGAGRGWLAFGLQGLIPYWLYTEATGYVNEQGRASLRLEFEYDWLLTQKLKLQPRIEMNFYSRNDSPRGVKNGLSDLEAGFRLRYEITREFAPYAGMEWVLANNPAAQNIPLNRTDEVRFVAGIHFWI
ncbi:MAG: copper resistance protein B [Methylococcaceae bacterium]|jgi:copper resistance protein B